LNLILEQLNLLRVFTLTISFNVIHPFKFRHMVHKKFIQSKFCK